MDYVDQSELRKLVEQRLTIREIAQTNGTSYTNVRYWLKKHGLKTYNGAHGAKPVDYELKRRCSTCGETDPSKFYGRKTRTCKGCGNTETVRRGHDTRRRAIELMGGKCARCGYAEYSCALDFHHVDASTKDVAFGTWRGWSWERVLKELPKCILLCKNCHAVEHHLLRQAAAANHGGASRQMATATVSKTVGVK